jgi:hypothetical protein
MAMTLANSRRSRGRVSVLVLFFFGCSAESLSVHQTSCAVGKRLCPFSSARHHDKIIIPADGKMLRLPTILYLRKLEPDDSSETDDRDKAAEETPAISALTEGHITTTENKNAKTNRLLTLPLLIKFVAVLFIKFVTDVVVFPALLLYRMAHILKRTLTSLFKIDDAARNGDNAPS